MWEVETLESLRPGLESRLPIFQPRDLEYVTLSQLNVFNDFKGEVGESGCPPSLRAVWKDK